MLFRKRKIRLLKQFGWIFFAFIAFAPPGPVSAMDHHYFGELLGKYVKEGVVDYRGLKKDENLLDNYLELLQQTDTNILGPEDQSAFYINAYNAWTIKLVLSKYPEIKSIRDIGNRLFASPFKKKFIRLGDQTVSLDHIENDILRPRFGDPRVHFAINCASKSCPPLLAKPYQGDTLDRQLNDITQAFINNPRFNYLAGNSLHISRIFKWFADDFGNDPLSFFLKYASGELKKNLEMRKAWINIKYLDYDWSLNGK